MARGSRPRPRGSLWPLRARLRGTDRAPHRPRAGARSRLVLPWVLSTHSPNSILLLVNPAEHADQVQTLVHELAHALIRADPRADDPQLSYKLEEVVVESVAYSVCASLGLDTAADSVPYLAGWGGAEAPDSIDRYAALIDRLASRLEDALAGVDPQPAQGLT